MGRITPNTYTSNITEAGLGWLNEAQLFFFLKWIGMEIIYILYPENQSERRYTSTEASCSNFSAEAQVREEAANMTYNSTQTATRLSSSLIHYPYCRHFRVAKSQIWEMYQVGVMSENKRTAVVTISLWCI